jgi:hypothetical protein
MDLTTLAGLKLDSLDPESGRGDKRNRTSYSSIHNVSLHRCIGRGEASGSRCSSECRDPNLYSPVRGNRAG